MIQYLYDILLASTDNQDLRWDTRELVKDLVSGGWVVSPKSVIEPSTVTTPGGGGGRRARVLYADPPPLEIGTEVPDHQRQRRPKANLLEPLEGQKMGFQPMCLYSKYSVFLAERTYG